MMFLVNAIAESESIELDPKNPDQFAQLVEIHHRELLVYARSLTQEANTARDIVQDAFVVAYQKVDSFDVTRDFGTWMRGIVRNKWREWLRKNLRYELTDEELSLVDSTIADWQAENAKGNATLFDSLEHCLSRLPEHLHEAVQTYYYEGRSGDESSEQLGIAPAAVRKRLQRARNLLKDCLNNRLETTD